MRSETDTPPLVAVVAYDGVAMFEFSAACKVFGHGGPLMQDGRVDPPLYRLQVCGARPRVRATHGIVLDVPHHLAVLGDADIVVLPPCDTPETVPDRTLAAVCRAHERGARVLSLCTGAFVLARTGLLDGRRAVTHWEDCDAFADAYPQVTVDPSVLYIDDGDVLTSAGSAASIDLCLHVVRTDHGARTANELARSLVVPPHRDGGQAQYTRMPMPPPPAEDPFSATVAWMHDHLDQPQTVAGLARRAAASERHFTRRFVAVTGTTPHQWLTTYRVRRAQHLLEVTDLPIQAVAERSGLGHAANLRKQFRRHLQTSPHTYRTTFTHTDQPTPTNGSPPTGQS